MSGRSSSKPQTNTIKDAERITIRWLGIGFLLMGLGFVLSLASASTGVIAIIAGGAIVLGTVGWIVFVSRYNSVVKICPRCRQTNHMFSGETYFRCSSCGYFGVFGEG